MFIICYFFASNFITQQGRSVGRAYEVMCDAVNKLRLADEAIQLVI